MTAMMPRRYAPGPVHSIKTILKRRKTKKERAGMQRTVPAPGTKPNVDAADISRLIQKERQEAKEKVQQLTDAEENSEALTYWQGRVDTAENISQRIRLERYNRS
ncbi:hypothetical protein [Salibacterium sp. K-3]